MESRSESKIDGTAVAGLIDNINKVTDIDNSKIATANIEAAISILYGDLRSIDRQIDQREIGKKLDSKLGSEYDIEQHEQWISKIRRAVQYKKDQIRSLERALGNARDRLLDRRYLFVDKLYEIAKSAADLVDDLDELNDKPIVDKIYELESHKELQRNFESLDRSWENWCE
jgi:hypothetical protein